MFMPKYKCYKEVHALKIKSILNPNDGLPTDDGERVLTFSNPGFDAAAFVVSPDYMRKHNPQVGGYYVVYQDGYKSYSPAEPFESGYSLVSE